MLFRSQPAEGPGSYQVVANVVSQHRGPGLSISPGLFLASPNWQDVRFTRDASDVVRIEQQIYTGRATPLAVAGYELLENTFGPSLRVGGLPISNTPNGWEFAVFRKIGTP